MRQERIDRARPDSWFGGTVATSALSVQRTVKSIGCPNCVAVDGENYGPTARAIRDERRQGLQTIARPCLIWAPVLSSAEHRDLRPLIDIEARRAPGEHRGSAGAVQ